MPTGYISDDAISTLSPLSLHPSPSATTSKPTTAPRVLILVLQALVMSLALLLFFLFAGIAALVLIHLLIAGRALRYRPPCKVGSDPGLSLEELKGLPCRKYVSKGTTASVLMWWPDCAVCLEGFRDGDRCRVMPECGHAFHKSCVDRWLVRNAVCPVCRKEVGGRGGSWSTLRN